MYVHTYGQLIVRNRQPVPAFPLHVSREFFHRWLKRPRYITENVNACCHSGIRCFTFFRVIFSSVESTSASDVSEENNFAQYSPVYLSRKKSRLIFGAFYVPYRIFPSTRGRYRENHILYLICAQSVLDSYFSKYCLHLYSQYIYVNVDRKTNDRTSP